MAAGSSSPSDDDDDSLELSELEDSLDELLVYAEEDYELSSLELSGTA